MSSAVGQVGFATVTAIPVADVSANVVLTALVSGLSEATAPERRVTPAPRAELSLSKGERLSRTLGTILSRLELATISDPSTSSG